MKGNALFLFAAAAALGLTGTPALGKGRETQTAKSVMASVSHAQQDCRTWLRGRREGLKEAKAAKRKAQRERRQVSAIASWMSPFASPSLSSASFTNVPTSEEQEAEVTIVCLELLEARTELASK